MVASFREGVVDYLVSAISSLSGRLHPAVLPDKPELPAVVYRVITNEGMFAHDGPIHLRNPRLQLDVWSRRMAEAETISQELITALLGYRGAMGDVEYTAGWRLEDSSDLYEEDSKLFRISMDFRGWYAEE